MWNKFKKLNQKTNIGILCSQHQCWDAARGPGVEPPASLESALKVRVHGLSLYNKRRVFFDGIKIM
jgi:hypothetical protein